MKKHFPNEQILRIDSDSTQQKNSLDEALEKAKAGKAKILVGTQMLSKGHHFFFALTGSSCECRSRAIQ